MSHAHLNHGPTFDSDEARLRQLDNLIAQAEEAERLEAVRKAEEERQRAEREAGKVSYTLDELKRVRETLAAQMAARQHHLRTEAEQDVMRRRAERLSADVQIAETKLADMRAERDALLARLG